MPILSQHSYRMFFLFKIFFKFEPPWNQRLWSCSWDFLLQVSDSCSLFFFIIKKAGYHNKMFFPVMLTHFTHFSVVYRVTKKGEGQCWMRTNSRPLHNLRFPSSGERWGKRWGIGPAVRVLGTSVWKRSRNLSESNCQRWAQGAGVQGALQARLWQLSVLFIREAQRLMKNL